MGRLQTSFAAIASSRRFSLAASLSSSSADTRACACKSKPSERTSVCTATTHLRMHNTLP